jgi:peptide/nickel transport system substrate-binding protein
MDTSLDLTSYFHSRAIALGTNVTRYSNPEVDRLIDHAMSQPDVALGRQDLDRIQEILHRDQPYTFLWESERLCGFDRRLHGVKPSMAFSFYDLEDWWVEPTLEH